MNGSLSRSIRWWILWSVFVSGLVSLFGQWEDYDPETGQGWKLIAWNDLGMHCLDDDFSVFSLLPPYNTINAQVLSADGSRVDGASGVQLYYEAVRDPDGSISLSSSDQTNFWEHAEDLFGGALEADVGLAGNRMPGANNEPQKLHWVQDRNWWEAVGIPMIAKNSKGQRQTYPMLRITARNASGALLAETRIVTPVSDEMNCRTCHQSNGMEAAKPSGGWVNDSDVVRDYRLNILRRHDARLAWSDEYRTALAALNYHENGLEATVRQMGKAVLCASCHASNALAADGQPGIRPLTQAIHGAHASVLDPATGVALGASTNRASCYQCHPGQDTRCLRGAMGNARDEQGQLSMSCQSCHGGMAQVADSARSGWFDEPSCQSCHTGSETHNSGQLRFLTSFTETGEVRQAAEARFATQADQPAAGFDLYRFSRGHGGLYCSACHGSPHAIFPSHEMNDNLQNIALQGHAGTLADCSSCHGSNGVPNTIDGGPHGMHAVGDWWVSQHGEIAEDNAGSCAACHGTDFKGGVLSSTFADRRFGEGGRWTFFRGQQVSCYDCHRGPSSDDHNTSARPLVASFQQATEAGVLVGFALQGSDADSASLSYRIVKQPEHGELSQSGSQIFYTPDPGFVGTDYFEYCARDDQRESMLGVVSLAVGSDPEQADVDLDGIPDLLERALGMSTERDSVEGYARIRMERGEGSVVTLRALYDARLIPPDLEVEVQVSDDLQTWSSDVEGLSTQVNAQGMTVTTYEGNLEPGVRQFMRFYARQLEL